MRPLQPLGLGLLVVALTAPVHGYDALPDPLGWLLVLAGVTALPHGVPRVRALRVASAVAGVIAVPLWVAGVADRLYDTDPALAWAATLPQLAATLLLADGLARAATRAGDRSAARWLGVTTALLLVVAVLPVLVLGAGVTALGDPTALLASTTLVLLVVLLLTFARRPWASGVRSGPVPVGDDRA